MIGNGTTQHNRSTKRDVKELIKLPSIGLLKADILYDAGYRSLRELKMASVVELMNIEGIGRISAAEIKTTLRENRLEDIWATEFTTELLGNESRCPLCGTVVSTFESLCYECGTTLKVSDDTSDISDVDPENNSHKKALSHYDSELLRSPDNLELWYARGSTLMEMGEYVLALVSFDKALNIGPHYQKAWMAKAELFNRIDEPMNAAECFSHVVSSTALDQVIKKSEEYVPIGDSDIFDDIKLDSEKDSVPVDNISIDSVSMDDTVVGNGSTGNTKDVQARMPIDDILRNEISEKRPEKMDMPSTLKDKDPEALKRILSKKAADLKELLIFAKDLSINVDNERGLIVKAIQYNRKGRIKEAITLLDEGCNKIENVLKGSTLSSNIEQDTRINGGNL